jgi:hypothetical protein
MSIGTLYIGTHDYDFSQLDTELLTKDNYKSARSGWRKKDYHTSIEDLNLKVNECKQLVKDCNNIEFLDWEIQSSPDYPLRNVILALFDLYFGSDPTFNEPLIKNSDLHRASRTTDDPVLWTAGCSFTSADGVEFNERFGHLVATELGLEEVNTASPGASIWDASDQILRADIRKDDIVVWGLTNVSRIDIVQQGRLRSSTIKAYYQIDPDKQYYTLDYFDSSTIKVKYVRQIQQVINFCSKIGAKLHIVNFLDFNNISGIYLKDKNVSYLNFKLQPDGLIDYGTDREHPGPLQHQHFANEIIKLIQGE